MCIEADILAKDYPWNQIHAGKTHHPHKAISGAIQYKNTEYQNITCTITSHFSKTTKR